MTNKMTGLWCTILLLACFPVLAIEWGELSTEQQEVLAPYQDQWQAFNDERQEQLAEGAARWAAMNQKDQEEIQQRFDRWQALPAERKETLKQRFEEYQQLSPRQQKRLQKKMQTSPNDPPTNARNYANGSNRWINGNVTPFSNAMNVTTVCSDHQALRP